MPVRQRGGQGRRSTPPRRRPIKLVTIGAGERAFEIGNEVVLFRHEKTFYHQPGLVVRVQSDDPELADIAARVAAYEVERVGMKLRLDGIAVQQSGGDAAAYAAAVDAARAAAPGLPLILASDDAGGRRGGARRGRRRREAAHLGRHGRQLAGDGRRRQEAWLSAGHLRAEDGDLGALADLSEQVRGAGVEDLILDPGTTSLAGDLAAFTQLRRLALKKGSRALGFPIIAFAGAPTWQAELVRADQAIAKYAGLIVLDHFEPGALYALLTLRQNIYTDPQKPIQVEPKLYEVGAPNADSPLLITTNFSLTYFSVSGEVEGVGDPGMAARRRLRRPVGAHRLGGRQVRRREDRQDRQGLRHRRQAEPQEAGHPRACRRTVRRDRRGAARLADHGRPARRRRHPELPEDRLERVTAT